MVILFMCIYICKKPFCLRDEIKERIVLLLLYYLKYLKLVDDVIVNLIIIISFTFLLFFYFWFLKETIKLKKCRQKLFCLEV